LLMGQLWFGARLWVCIGLVDKVRVSVS